MSLREVQVSRHHLCSLIRSLFLCPKVGCWSQLTSFSVTPAKFSTDFLRTHSYITTPLSCECLFIRLGLIMVLSSLTRNRCVSCKTGILSTGTYRVSSSALRPPPATTPTERSLLFLLLVLPSMMQSGITVQTLLTDLPEKNTACPRTKIAKREPPHQSNKVGTLPYFAIYFVMWCTGSTLYGFVLLCLCFGHLSVLCKEGDSPRWLTFSWGRRFGSRKYCAEVQTGPRDGAAEIFRALTRFQWVFEACIVVPA